MKPAVRVKKVKKTEHGRMVRYACPVCDTGFLDEQQWEQHEAKHHK